MSQNDEGYLWEEGPNSFQVRRSGQMRSVARLQRGAARRFARSLPGFAHTARLLAPATARCLADAPQRPSLCVAQLVSPKRYHIFPVRSRRSRSCAPRWTRG